MIRAVCSLAVGAVRPFASVTVANVLSMNVLVALRSCIAVVMLAVSGLAIAQPAWESTSEGLAPIPPLTARVTDVTQTLSASEKAALEAKLADFERRTGNQLVVLMVPTTRGEPIEGYSLRVAEGWKIGRKGQDNGALFVIAKDDRKMRIEVGYGLEGVLTDVTSRRIIAENVAPLFRQNRFGAGVDAGVDRIIAVVGTGQPLPAQQRATPSRRTQGFDFQTLLILLFVGVPVLGGILSRVFGRMLGSTVGAGVVGAGAWLVAGSIAIGVGAGVIALIIMLMFSAGGGIGRRGGTWIPTGGWGGGGLGGGGGFSGGGGGGFSGGGGSFGGGGASGGW
jgi:uncharacterized protein